VWVSFEIGAFLCQQRRSLSKGGDPAPDFTLKCLDGRELRLSDYRGKRVLLFVWASWESCREQLPVWQGFYNRHQGEGFELISVAMDALGYGVVRPFVEKAGATFPTVVDSADGLWDLYGFEIIPNGYYIDERATSVISRLGALTFVKPQPSRSLMTCCRRNGQKSRSRSLKDPTFPLRRRLLN
jgi:peroxiredoxin